MRKTEIVSGTLYHFNYNYSYKDNSFVKPYNHWIANGKPIAKFEYLDGHRLLPRLSITFIPYSQLLVIEKLLESYDIDRYSCKTKLDDGTKTFTLTHFSTLDPDIIKQLTKWTRLFANFTFEPVWTVKKHREIQHMDLHDRDETLPMTYTKMTACYFHIKDAAKAATLIQAVFRGWKARMQFRFNPQTSLGKWIILKQFYDLIE